MDEFHIDPFEFPLDALQFDDLYDLPVLPYAVEERPAKRVKVEEDVEAGGGGINKCKTTFVGNNHKGDSSLSSSQIISFENNWNYESVKNWNCTNGKRSCSMNGREHVIAERKRREKLSQRFIALSALIPDLNKVLCTNYTLVHYLFFILTFYISSCILILNVMMVKLERKSLKGSTCSFFLFFQKLTLKNCEIV